MNLLWKWQHSDSTDDFIESFLHISGRRNKEDLLELAIHAKELDELIGGFLEWDEVFDSFEELKDHIENMTNSQRQYSYDYTPEGNHVNLVFSSIELPFATPALEAGEFLDESYQ